MDCSIADLFGPGQPQFALDEILHEGAQAMLKQALVAEVDAYLEAKMDVRDLQGRRQVVRNGYLPERQISTPVGRLSVKQPRVRDKRGKEGEAFESSIVPPYMRRSPKLDELIPWLYLKGISTGDMLPALEALVGKSSKGFSASTIVRLKEHWTREFESWNQRDLSEKEYVYFWADGIHFNIRLEEDRQCILVVMGAPQDGKKELVAVLDGFRESTQSWRELLLDVKHRGLEIAPKLAVGDGALGFWNAMAEIYPSTPSATMLGSQDFKPLEQVPQASPAEGEEVHSQHLAGRDARSRDRRLQRVHREIWRQVSEGHGVPDQGPGRAPGLLRLPPRSTGGTCGQRTSSSRRSRPCACATGRRRVRRAGWRAWRWSSSCSSPHRSGGAVCKVTCSLERSSQG